jgi:hypothetical protein
MSGILKTCQLVAVDYLRESTMEEHVLNIKLMDWPAAEQSQEEHSVHYGGLDDRT